MSTYIVKENNFSACCNLILWDLFITWLFTFGMASTYLPNLSTFQHVIIGLVGVFILMVLMVIPYIGPVIQVLFSVLWTAVAYYLIDQLFHISEYSILWRCGIGLICFIIVVAIHFGSAEDMDIFSFTRSTPLSNITYHNSSAKGVPDESSSYDMNISSMHASLQEEISDCEKQYKLAISLSDTVTSLPDNPNTMPLKDFVKQDASDLVRKYNHLVRNVDRYNKTLNDTMLQQLTSILDDCTLALDIYIDTLQEMLEEYKETNANFQGAQSNNAQDTPKNAANSTYFKGCDTLDKLNKRYRDLVKIYHSDSGNGNDEIFVEVTEEYNTLKENIMH